MGHIQLPRKAIDKQGSNCIDWGVGVVAKSLVMMV